ncbi:hypothetical protein PF005_g6235 [Phytophthora fragariae]|uniref:Uncharacterized protein n=1 Tax=Phytophthora fragariae TaxID=53985 RepID=A0A6A3FE96_9STRA|nr:hypothetical protein PF003_g24038 [Phytophthora fragariae]KAE8942916.1 hypothetical protein PF009_g7344 [Phytophthora fragariae]KAE9020669.1 hypothetical protein PF011_g5301 [Phytophthora fragariae]KAE9125297.1 hypothetical protein PF010_g5679 [Phytophthora fragariae]KAE9147423.1 hypothetical protein PF006_g7892 [Phytophthora fragariae]
MVSLGGVRVNIVEARGILASDDVDTSDPYGTMMLLDAKGQALRVPPLLSDLDGAFHSGDVLDVVGISVAPMLREPLDY